MTGAWTTDWIVADGCMVTNVSVVGCCVRHGCVDGCLAHNTIGRLDIHWMFLIEKGIVNFTQVGVGAALTVQVTTAPVFPLAQQSAELRTTHLFVSSSQDIVVAPGWLDLWSRLGLCRVWGRLGLWVTRRLRLGAGLLLQHHERVLLQTGWPWWLIYFCWKLFSTCWWLLLGACWGFLGTCLGLLRPRRKFVNNFFRFLEVEWIVGPDVLYVGTAAAVVFTAPVPPVGGHDGTQSLLAVLLTPGITS